MLESNILYVECENRLSTQLNREQFQKHFLLMSRNYASYLNRNFLSWSLSYFSLACFTFPVWDVWYIMYYTSISYHWKPVLCKTAFWKPTNNKRWITFQPTKAFHMGVVAVGSFRNFTLVSFICQAQYYRALNILLIGFALWWVCTHSLFDNELVKNVVRNRLNRIPLDMYFINHTPWEDTPILGVNPKGPYKTKVP